MTIKQTIIRFIFILAFLPFTVLLGKAQSNLAFYHNTDQFNSSNYNPAFLSYRDKFTFSILPFAGMSVGYNNQLVIRDMLLKNLRGDQTKDDFKQVFNSMVKLDIFYQRTEISLFDFGYHSNQGSFNFRIKENILMMTDLKNQFSAFFSDPLTSSIQINKPEIFPALAMHYREFSLGYGSELIENKFNFGVRAKLYFGKFSMLSDVQGDVVRKDNGNYYVQTGNQLKLSFPAKIEQKDSLFAQFEVADNFNLGDYVFNTGNVGTGFDLGFTYKIASDLLLSASIVDLGKINWKNSINNLNYISDYQLPDNLFEGNAVDGKLTKKFNAETDSTIIKNLYKVRVDRASFSTRIPTTIYAGLKYRVNSRLNIGIVDRYIFTKYMNFNSLSITGVYDLKKNLTLTTGYSIIANTFTNIPFALVYNWDRGQYYFGTDNLISFFLPKISDFSGVNFGVCYYLFKKGRKYDDQLDYLPFYLKKKDRKNTQKGLKYNNYD